MATKTAPKPASKPGKSNVQIPDPKKAVTSAPRKATPTPQRKTGRGS